MRTQSEIVERIEKVREMDILGFETSEYPPYLDFEHARPYLKEGTTEKDWASHPELTDEAVKAEMRDYIEFAWKKANGFRGISAGRSIGHYRAWFWLLGEAEAETELSEENYEFYGKDQLVWITEWLGLDPEKYDDGVRLNEEPV